MITSEDVAECIWQLSVSICDGKPTKLEYSFIEVQQTYNILHILKVFDLISFDMYIFL